MLTTLTTLTALGLAQLPPALDVPAALEGARVEVTLQATTNHFAAENGSSVVQILLIGSEGLPPRAVRLAPGSRVLYAFPRGAAEDLSVEVVALDEAGWRNTGAVRVEDLRASDERAAWVQAGSDRSVVWTVDTQQRLAHVTPDDQLVPDAWLAAHPELTEFGAHVPVPLPSEGKRSRRPVVIEKKKLPPV